MGRRVQIEIGGIRQGLPLRIGADQPDLSLPDLFPGAPVLLAESLKPTMRGHPNQPRGLAVRLVMHLARDQAAELAQNVMTVRPSLDAVRGRQRREVIVLLAPPFDIVTTIELRDICSAAGRQPS